MKPRPFLSKVDILILSAFLVLSLILNIIIWYVLPNLSPIFLPLAPIAVAVVVFLAIHRHDQRLAANVRRNDYLQLEAWIVLQSLVKPRLPIIGLRDGATSPDLAVILCKEILHSKPKVIVECGAGKSTLIIASLLESIGEGKLITLEHDAFWAQRVNLWIEEHGLGHRACVIHAPLVNHDTPRGLIPWYETSKFEQIMGDAKIDLLFIDGPAGHIHSHIRYPAIPKLQPCLKSNSIIVVDDTDRIPDKINVDDWSALLNTAPEWLMTEKGCAVIRLHG